MKGALLSPESHLVPIPGAVAAPLGDELVVLSLSDGAYFCLSPVAASSWRALDGLRSVNDVAQRIVEEFETDEVTATSDLLDLFRDLLNAGLVSHAPEP